jgi:hypothetical protein
MNAKHLLYPLLPMFLLTCIVAATMLRRRIAFYKSNRVHPQKTATSAQMTATIADTRASDNFRNLFEIPVLFYVAVFAAYALGIGSMVMLALAWGFVAGRYAHSYIHCTSNIVMRRFYAFLFSCFCLIGMWGILAYQLLFVP